DDDKSEAPKDQKDDDKSEAPKDQKDDEPTKSTTPKETPKKDDPLADTGANSVPLIAAGGAMALAGAAFLLFRRSARRQG
ncbi:LPXTG cell wall anchor domain-containing protein, partial [Glutamicibacter arilaitensis]